MNSTPANSSRSRLVRWTFVIAAGICSMAVIGAARGNASKTVANARLTPIIDVAPAAPVTADSNAELMHDVSAEATLASVRIPAVSHKKVVTLEVTAYCGCPKCCGPHAHGLTASGRSIAYNGGQFVAADTKLFKFGTRLSIPGYAAGQPVEVIDRGGAIKGYHIDVFFSDHQQAKTWGRQHLQVTVEE